MASSLLRSLIAARMHEDSVSLSFVEEVPIAAHVSLNQCREHVTLTFSTQINLCEINTARFRKEGSTRVKERMAIAKFITQKTSWIKQAEEKKLSFFKEGKEGVRRVLAALKKD